MKIHLEQIKANDEFHRKISNFVDSQFVKTSEELVIGLALCRGAKTFRRSSLIHDRWEIWGTKTKNQEFWHIPQNLFGRGNWLQMECF